VPVSDDLIDQACAALGVMNVAAIGEGGQKSVRRVEVKSLATVEDTDGVPIEPNELMVVPRVPGAPSVLKVIQLGNTSPEALERAQREVLLLQRIDSPHMVRAESDLVILGDPPQGAAWLEELLAGTDLDQNLGDPWDERSAARLIEQVSLGIAEMHDGAVTHRDLSPMNVRVVSPDRYVVIDPGYARHELLPAITVIGQPGTPGFMSPEHLRQPPNGPTLFSDVFCIGILGYLVLTGSPPIPYNHDREDYVERLNVASHIPITDLRSNLDPGLATVIQKCLHPQPARRYKHGRAVATAIQEIQWLDR
jgi:serine/threonine protein kinase